MSSAKRAAPDSLSSTRRDSVHTSEALLDIVERTHRSLNMLMDHCQELEVEELSRPLDGFGYPSVRILPNLAGTGFITFTGKVEAFNEKWRLIQPPSS